MSPRDRAWVKKEVVAEVTELIAVGHAANVQDWAGDRQVNTAECAELRREARRLIRAAIEAVERA